jgi:adenosine deaminase
VDHPVRAFVEAGCRVVVGDDDPTTTGSRLSSEIAVLGDRVRLSAAEIAEIHETSIAVAFAEIATRAAIRERLLAGQASADRS